MLKKSPILTFSSLPGWGRRRGRAGVLIAVLAVFAHICPAWAKSQVNASYRVYVHGFKFGTVLVNYRLTPQAYAIRMHIDSMGLLSLLVKLNVVDTGEGYFTGDWVHPLNYESRGYSRGAQRHVLLQYGKSGPMAKVVDPNEPDREAVPAKTLDNALDTLAAMALLQHRMVSSRSCNGVANVFDGLRLTRIQVSGPISTNVPTSDSQRFVGETLRCDISGAQIAGFMKNSQNRGLFEADSPGAVWFDTFPSTGLLVVRFEFRHPKLGKIVAVLDSFSTS